MTEKNYDDEDFSPEAMKKLFDEMRKDASVEGEMTLDEINEEIRLARKEMRRKKSAVSE